MRARYSRYSRYSRYCTRHLKLLLLACTTGITCAAFAAPTSVTTLRDEYTSLTTQLQNNPFRRPLVLRSAETGNRLKGDIYAVVDFPFSVVSAALDDPDHWCDVMILHINTKYCQARTNRADTTLQIYFGKKTPQKLSDATRIDFTYKVAAATPDYLDIMLSAKDGPLGTSDTRIQLEVVSIPNSQKSFLHLTYSYTVNFSGRLAVQAYLATAGRGKVGHTVTGKQADGQPDYINGVRGMMERNTMRYYLAIDTFLATAGATPATQSEKRFKSWYAATEQYALQLHEVSRDDYLEMKRAEYLRQQAIN